MIRNMVVTSAIFWLLFAIFVLVIYTNHSFSAKMTYGLVYRPLPQQAASSNAEQVTIESSTALPTEYPSYEPNETKISTQVQRAPATDTSSTLLTTDLHSQNFSGTRLTGNLKYSKKEVPVWMVPNGVLPHQYQVYENDSEAEESGHRFKTSSLHGDKGEHGKKESKGGSGNDFKEKKNSKKGEEGHKKSKMGKKLSKHGGHKSFSKKEGAFEKHGGKSKKGSHASGKKKKNYSYKKGFKNKYKMDKEDNVHEFWNDHHEKGEFIVYGEKKKSAHDSKKGNKKHKWKKKSKKGRKKKKKGKKSKKENEKEEKGYNEKKGTKHFYHNEKEYGHNHKMKLDEDQKKS